MLAIIAESDVVLERLYHLNKFYFDFINYDVANVQH